MRVAAIRHIEMAGELAALQAIVTSVMELVLGLSPDEIFWVEITDKLVSQFWKLEELCSWLEWTSTRICDLLLGPPPHQAQWADRLDEAVGWLDVELTTWQPVDAELEALRISNAWVHDLVLDNIYGPSSPAAPLSMVAELLKGRIDVAATNEVRWGTWCTLVVVLSKILELKSEVEVLGSGRNADLMEDQADAL
jgi:hypothetical protein